MLVKYVNVAQNLNSFCQKSLVCYHFQINLSIFKIWTFWVTVHDNIQYACNSLEVYIYFSPTILNFLF